MSLNIARQGRIWAVAEGSFGSRSATFASADAIRHKEFKPLFDPYPEVATDENKLSAGIATYFDRRTTGSWSGLFKVRPSGTLNTLPEASEILEAAFGSKSNITLATTVDDSTVPTTKSAKLGSVTGLAVGQGIRISRNSVLYVRRIKTIVGSVIAWDNALPSAPVNGEAVVGCTTYTLTTDLALTLSFLHVLPNFARWALGCNVDSIGFKCNANEEVEMAVSGMLKELLSNNNGVTLPTTPGAFTTVGGNPPNCNSGDLWIADNAFKHLNFNVGFKNGLKMRSDESGNDGYPTESYRETPRVPDLTIDCYAETQSALYDLAQVGTVLPVLKQVGRTAGNIIAFCAPAVRFKLPETSDAKTAAQWPFKGTPRESIADTNDELALILA